MKRPSIPNLRISSLPLLLFSFPTLVLSNTEKTIFLGPETVRVPSQQPTLSDLHLEVLTPQAHDNKWSLRTALPRQFPNSTHPHGPATWLLLDNLTQGQRYELRVCWAATQPTSFQINTYPLDTVFSTPELITSLNDYSLSRQGHHSSETNEQVGERESSLLFLQILSTADYFTTNSTLMKNPPPVDVDIILDPFLLNVLPRSLLPTVIYIVVVAIVAYLLSSRVLLLLDDALGLTPATTETATKEKKTN